MDNNDWRLFRNQIEYLYKAKLFFHAYTPKNKNNDHDHCEFCMEKFGFNKSDLHQGYSTEDNDIWICEECYNNFNDMFEWEVIKSEK